MWRVTTGITDVTGSAIASALTDPRAMLRALLARDGRELFIIEDLSSVTQNDPMSRRLLRDLVRALPKQPVQNGKGIVISKPGVVKACGYCPCAPICGQYQRLLASGDIASTDNA